MAECAECDALDKAWSDLNRRHRALLEGAEALTDEWRLDGSRRMDGGNFGDDEAGKTMTACARRLESLIAASEEAPDA